MAAGGDGLPAPLIVEEDRYATVPAVLQAYPPATNSPGRQMRPLTLDTATATSSAR
ncbi:hypothetical protein BGW80DRAFT_1463184 [Lactifluus volemus]|nr:hypothetical protein BGW80DRAFT_1463184 [Lactifluus volemus]